MDARDTRPPQPTASAPGEGPEEPPPMAPRSGLRAWQMLLVTGLFVGGWFALQWIALPYDGSFVKDDAPPLNLVPLEPVPAATSSAMPEAPTPWAPPAAAAADAVVLVPVTVHLSSGSGRVQVDDGAVAGTTPLDLALAPGAHRLQVETLATGDVYARDIQVETGRPLTVVVEVD